jgi:RNA polymerase sigma-70 factor (ECF subfamily)
LRKRPELRYGSWTTKESRVSSEPDRLLGILEAHGAELHALLTRLTLRAGVAADLLQDLFIKLAGAEGFHQAQNPKAYVFRTAVHLAFDWRRKQRACEHLTTDPAAVADSPLEQLIDAEELEQVLDAMQSLSPLAQQVVALRYLQHEEYAAIADQIGKTEHQARAICSKAIGELRGMLQPAPAREPEKRGARP